MKNKVKVIDNSTMHKCYKCSGFGRILIAKTSFLQCNICKGSGLWKEDSFILIAERPNGQKIAFQSDNPGT